MAAWAASRLKPATPVSVDIDRPVERSGHFDAMADEVVRLEGERVDEDAALRALERRFRFLNVERRLPVIDWSAEYESSLWTYHLHYFDYAVDLASVWRLTGDERYGRRFIELWTGWLDAAATGEASLEPYPTSVRCMNALRSLWLVHDRVSTDFADRLLRGTRVQLGWLADNIERHLRANHLQKNLTALAWGALVFGDERAARWRRYLNELWEELREQALADGCHFERSPMYHAAALDDFLRTLSLCRVARVPVPDDVKGRLEAMTRALQWLSRPDGTLHLFNDATNGERPGRKSVVELACSVLGERFPEPSGAFSLENAGYFGCIDTDAGRRLVIDAGPLGPSYQPGHAHCDMLSFELDLAGRAVIVDSGLHGYDGDPFREYVRSTRAHNTVAIDGRDQHEMWATFRVARRGEIVEASCREVTRGRFEFVGACRHYHDSRALHRRSIEFSGGRLAVYDRVEGADGRRLMSWLHLHPDFQVKAAEEGLLAIAEGPPAMTVCIDLFGVDEVSIHSGEFDPVRGWYCPEFGTALFAPAITLSIAANDGREFGYRLREVVS